jgi:DNA-binding protein H-NS
MSKLSTIRKQIAALEFQAARIAKEEMDSAIGKVKSLMSDFGLTIEHLTQSITSKPVPKKSKAAPKKAAVKKGASAAKYADPETGKTWSGVGRAPGWIVGAKSRDAFLVNKSGSPSAVATPLASKKAALRKARKSSIAAPTTAPKAAVRKSAVAGKNLAASVKRSTVAVKASSAKKPAVAKKRPLKKLPSKKSATPKASAATALPATAAE